MDSVLSVLKEVRKSLGLAEGETADYQRIRKKIKNLAPEERLKLTGCRVDRPKDGEYLQYNVLEKKTFKKWCNGLVRIWSRRARLPDGVSRDDILNMPEEDDSIYEFKNVVDILIKTCPHDLTKMRRSRHPLNYFKLLASLESDKEGLPGVIRVGRRYYATLPEFARFFAERENHLWSNLE